MRWVIDVQLYFIDLTHNVLFSVNNYAAFRRSIMKVLQVKHSVDLKLTYEKLGRRVTLCKRILS
jgi:hypothetical protein